MTARISTGEFEDTLKIKQDASSRNTNTLRDTVRRPLVEQINAEGVVMLQNKGILPLDLSDSGVSSIAIVGSWQTNGYTGLYSQASGNQLNIQGGIQNAVRAKKSSVTFTNITSDCDSVNSMQNLNYINPRTGKVLTAPEAFAATPSSSWRPAAPCA